jgi:hypothetical protein
MVAALIMQCNDLHHGEIVSSCSFSAFFGTAAAGHHVYMMSLPGRSGSTIDPAGGLLN